MTDPLNPSQRKEFSSRRAQLQEQVTRDFLDFISAGALDSAATALHAAQELATNGPADSETLQKLASALLAVTKLAEGTAKACAAEASTIDISIRDAARLIQVSPITLKRWMESEDSDDVIPENAWWVPTPAVTGEETAVDTGENIPTGPAAQSAETSVSTPVHDQNTPGQTQQIPPVANDEPTPAPQQIQGPHVHGQLTNPAAQPGQGPHMVDHPTPRTTQEPGSVYSNPPQAL